MKTPYFFLETTICFLDDNTFFLEGVREAFGKDFSVLTFDNIENFLASINDDLVTDHLLSQAIKTEENTFESQSVIYLDSQSLVQGLMTLAALDKKLISIGFIDYSMPAGDGLDVINRMSNRLPKRVLLTGELGVEEAIESLNAQTIDAYLSKNSISIENDLRETIDNMRALYLKEINSTLDFFFLDNTHLKRLYDSKEFSAFFWKMIDQKKITHSSIFEPYGSQLLLSKDACFLLNVYHQEEIDSLILPLLDARGTGEFKELSSKSSLLDYKTPTTLQIPSIESWPDLLTRDFSKLELDRQEYYLTFKKIEQRL